MNADTHPVTKRRQSTRTKRTYVQTYDRSERRVVSSRVARRRRTKQKVQRSAIAIAMRELTAARPRQHEHLGRDLLHFVSVYEYTLTGCTDVTLIVFKYV